jgi:membrane fusion protein, multidrug efflux system
MKFLRIFLIVTAFIAFHQGCSAPAEPGKETEEARVEPVRTMGLDYSEITRSLTYTANLLALREVHLASASPGRIGKIHVETGTRVSEGQLLVEMDMTQLSQAQVRLDNIAKDYSRLDTLRRAGSASLQQYDQIKAQYDLALSNVQFLSDNTRLTAPFPGTISGKYYENGEMFSGAPNTPAGKAAILSLVQTNRLKALVNISEKYYPHIRPGMPVEIGSDIYPGEVFNGTVTVIYPTINPATRSFTVEIEVPNSNEKLRPGMFARATIDLERLDAFVVPSLAVLKLQGSNERYVFLEENGRARRVVIQTGDRFDDQVEIISNEITPGSRLIVAGQARLLDGMAVKVQE